MNVHVHKYALSNSALTSVELNEEGSKLSTPKTGCRNVLVIALTTLGMLTVSHFSPKINSQAQSVGIS